MVQVLHLTSTMADLQAEATAAAIRKAAAGEDAGVTVTTRTIGVGGSYRNAAHAALSLRFGRGILFDVIHAFDVPSLAAACAGPSPVVFSPSAAPPVAPALLRAAMVYRNGIAIANSQAHRRLLIARGVPAQRCDLIPPIVEADVVTRRRDDALRTALGIEPADRIVLAPGESTRATGHLLALHAVSILHVLDPRWRLLVWGRGSNVGHLRRLAGTLRQPNVLRVGERRLGSPVRFDSLLAASDFALFTAPVVVSATPVALCMGAGLPIVAGAAPVTRELLRDGLTASVAPKLAPRLIAQRLLHLSENVNEADSLGRSARTEAAARFDVTTGTRRFLALYRQVAGVAPKGHGDPPGAALSSSTAVSE